MLTYLLAIAVGLGSFSLYMAAFFFPEVHRKYDLLWSGVGLFYALVLWVCAGRITGGVLLGQVASVSLLGWLGWQVLLLRRAQTPVDQQTQLPPSATSAPEVMQITLDQFRANLQQSASRSPLAARLNQAIDRVETTWIDLSSWFKALTSPPLDSTADHSPKIKSPEVESSKVKSPVKSPKANSPKPSSQKTSPTAEPYAEWSELETESYPELDTIDGSITKPARFDLNSHGARSGTGNGAKNGVRKDKSIRDKSITEAELRDLRD